MEWRRTGGPRLLPLFVGAALAVALQPSAAHAGACPRLEDASNGLPTAGEWRTHPAVGDVNRDGHADLAVLPRKGIGPSVFLGDGKGNWTHSSAGLRVPGFSCGVGVALADVNGDGRLDLGIADHCSGLFVFLGDGKGGWRLGPGVTRAIGRGYQDLAFADLNGDGNLDIAAVGAFQGGIVAIHGDGKGGWKEADAGLPTQGRGGYIRTGDVNEDGRPDIVASFEQNIGPLPPDKAKNVVWLSQASGRYEPSTPGVPSDLGWNGVALGDVNHDGHLDMALGSDYLPDRPPVSIYLGDGGKSWKLAVEGLPVVKSGSGFDGLDLADLDGDGNLDLVASDNGNDALRMWMGDGKGAWSECPAVDPPQGRDPSRGWGVTVRDLNGDGRLDIVMGSGVEGRGRLQVWFNRKP